ASFLMIFSMFTPVLSSVSAASVNQKEHSFEVNTKEKIEAELEEEFSTNKQASFIIKFKEEAETQSVIENVKTQAKKGNLSSYETELKQRSAVISELKSTAIKSQENVLTYLNEQEKLGDRKSTRLNSSHVSISYAVFCLKKKKNIINNKYN